MDLTSSTIVKCLPLKTIFRVWYSRNWVGAVSGRFSREASLHKWWYLGLKLWCRQDLPCHLFRYFFQPHHTTSAKIAHIMSVCHVDVKLRNENQFDFRKEYMIVLVWGTLLCTTLMTAILWRSAVIKTCWRNVWSYEMVWKNKPQREFDSTEEIKLILFTKTWIFYKSIQSPTSKVSIGVGYNITMLNHNFGDFWLPSFGICSV